MNLFGTSGNNAWMSIIAGPGHDAVTLVREIGALVLDIQTMGDHAIMKWEHRATTDTDATPIASNVSSVAITDSRQSWDFSQ